MSERDRIALVDAEGRVLAVADHIGGNGTSDPGIVIPHINAGGTVQRVASTVQVGDQWPGVCEWSRETATDNGNHYWQAPCGYMTTHWRPSPFCPTCGKAVDYYKPTTGMSTGKIPEWTQYNHPAQKAIREAYDEGYDEGYKNGYDEGARAATTADR